MVLVEQQAKWNATAVAKLLEASMTIFCRGIRGATTVEVNTSAAILEATHELLQLIIEANELDYADVGSVIFTTTTDINAEFPAIAARRMGWHDVALMCGHEMAVPGSLQLCIRVLIHWNTPKSQAEIKHVYIRGARNLRPDRSAALDSVKL
jgi:chorismate mutase